MGVPFLAGQRITAADLNTATQQSAWTSYSPSWVASGTNPAIGTGTIVGYYAKVGRLVTAKIGIYTSSTTTFGTGTQYWITLPFTAAVTGVPNTADTPAAVGTCTLVQAGPTFYTGHAVILETSPTVVRAVTNATGTYWNPTSPATWTTGAEFVVTITYESTS